MTIKFMQQFMEKVFLKRIVNVGDDGFFRSLARWTIDSKYRTQKRMDYFLKDQLTYIYEQVERYELDVAYDANAVVAYNTAIQLRYDSKDPDDLIVNVHNHIYSVVTYKFDKDNFSKDEYWADMLETLQRKFDDCDGMNGAIYVMARLAGIHPINLYSCLGNTTAGYHYWNLYYSTTHNKVVSIDSTFYPNNKTVQFRPAFVLNKSRYLTLDYIFNEEVIWKIK